MLQEWNHAIDCSTILEGSSICQHPCCMPLIDHLYPTQLLRTNYLCRSPIKLKTRHRYRPSSNKTISPSKAQLHASRDQRKGGGEKRHQRTKWQGEEGDVQIMHPNSQTFCRLPTHGSLGSILVCQEKQPKTIAGMTKLRE